MQWFPASNSNLTTVNQTVTNITVTTPRANVHTVTHADKDTCTQTVQTAS